jgi:probable phosphoglycerate mutase
MAREYRQHRFVLPPDATDLLVVRHGESAPAREGEPFDLVGGHADPPLAPEGHEQADRLADRLGGTAIAAVYVTPLRRTLQTAQPLLNRLGQQPVVEEDLREVHLGEWEGGLFRQRVAEGHELAVRMFAEERWDVLPGAEPTAEFAARVRRGVLRIAGRHAGQRVLVVAHAGVIGQLMSIATGSRPFAFIGADNASISELVVQRDRWLVRRFNDTAHLTG